jgi:DNA-binding CsgD family transcriptional regulator
MAVADFTRARDQLIGLDRSEPSLSEVCEAIIGAFHTVTRFDYCAVMSTDSETMLPTGAVTEGFGPESCAPFWDNELLDPDFNKFTDLARSSDPVATLAEAVDGDLNRSPRHVKLYAPLGAVEEMRVAFVAGRSCLAVGAFVRSGADGPFPPGELQDVRALVPVATTALRRASGRMRCAEATEAPVVIILDAGGEISSMSAGGKGLLAELRAPGIEEAGLPGTVRAAATRARWSRNATTLATRVQRRDGRWMRLHVTPMDDDDGSVAVTIEPARSNDLVPILIASYDLTVRETDVVQRLARGLSAKEIAAELMISAHTVRDHIKVVYEKAGVNGRGELMARLFADHVLGRLEGVPDHTDIRLS